LRKEIVVQRSDWAVTSPYVKARTTVISGFKNSSKRKIGRKNENLRKFLKK